MGRRKKAVATNLDITNSKTEIEEKSITTPTNTLTYKGIVKISYMDKNGKICSRIKHNSGQIGLFTAVTRMLAGYTAFEYVPKYIQGYYASANNKLMPMFNNPIAYKNTPSLYYEGNQSNSECDTIEYVFLIPKNSINAIEATSIKTLALLNNLNTNATLEDESDNAICAKITFAEEDEISTDIDSNLIVY